MKFNKFAPLLLIATFVIGYLVTPSKYFPKKVPLQPDYSKEPTLEGLTLDNGITLPTEVFQIDSEKEALKRFAKRPIKLIETGDAFHGDDIDAKTGETWMGLFKSGKSFQLKSSSLIVKRVRDQIVDGEGSGKMTGKSVSVSTGEKPRFLVKGLRNTTSGEVTTIYNRVEADGDTPSEYVSIKPGFQKDFTISGRNYILTSMSGVDIKGKEIIALLLKSGDISQIIHTVPDFEDNYLGSVEWIGDIDRDGKPDLYLDLYIQDGVDYKNLFLSSQATKDNLVGKAAEFSTTGC